MKKIIISLALLGATTNFSMENSIKHLEVIHADASITIKTSDGITFHMPKELAARKLTPIRIQLDINPEQDEFEFRNIDSSQFMYCYLYMMKKGNDRHDVNKMVAELDDEIRQELIDAYTFLEYWPLLAELNFIALEKKQFFLKGCPTKDFIIFSDNPDYKCKLRKGFHLIPVHIACCLGCSIPLYKLKDYLSERVISVNMGSYEKGSIKPEMWDQLSLCTGLKRLRLVDQGLERLPNAISSLTNLKELRINSNKLSHLPSEFGRLTNLEKLSANNNQLTSLPDFFSLLINLRKLALSHNEFTETPCQLSALTKLKELYLVGNPLTSFPSSMSSLTNLRTLALTCDKFEPNDKERIRKEFAFVSKNWQAYKLGI